MTLDTKLKTIAAIILIATITTIICCRYYDEYLNNKINITVTSELKTFRQKLIEEFDIIKWENDDIEEYSDEETIKWKELSKKESDDIFGTENPEKTMSLSK